jgi:hypothetical protein
MSSSRACNKDQGRSRAPRPHKHPGMQLHRHTGTQPRRHACCPPWLRPPWPFAQGSGRSHPPLPPQPWPAKDNRRGATPAQSVKASCCTYAGRENTGEAGWGKGEWAHMGGGGVDTCEGGGMGTSGPHLLGSLLRLCLLQRLSLLTLPGQPLRLRCCCRCSSSGNPALLLFADLQQQKQQQSSRRPSRHSRNGVETPTPPPPPTHSRPCHTFS